MRSKITLKAVLFLLLLLPFQNAFSTRYYVISGGSGSGSSWIDGMGDLQAAINGASIGDEIWVKSGTYIPHATDRTVSFTMVSGVKIYGGFQGVEAEIEDRVLYDADGNGDVDAWEFQYPTILSGEIQDDGDESNNSQHIVIIPSGADASTLINGFVVEDGYCDTWISIKQGSYVSASGVLMRAGHIEKSIIRNCKSYSESSIVYASGLYVDNAMVKQVLVEGCSVMAKTAYGGGVVASQSTLLQVIVKDCSATCISGGIAIGGGVYTEASYLNSCQISSCHAISQSSTKAEGGGVYNNGQSSLLNCKISDCSALGSAGNGGGVYNITSSLANTVINNCEAGMNGGGLYSQGSYTANCVIANCKVSEDFAAGGGAYSLSGPKFFNTIFWGNISLGTAAQLRLSGDGVATNCAVQEEELSGSNNINVSKLNSGSEDGVLYPLFASPTDFVGLTGGETDNETSLQSADWNISELSSLIEKGSNTAFNEAHSSVGFDLNGDGDKADKIENFVDLDGENRLFNYNVDIGAYESAFIDLVLPTAQSIEYGSLLGDVILTGGSAKDNRDGSTLEGSYAFTAPSFKPDYSTEPQKFRVAFSPVDNVNYPLHYDTVLVTVTIKELTLSGLNANDKVYDSTTDVSFGGTAVLNGIVSGDDVSLSAGAVSASFTDKNVGEDKDVAFTGYALSGADKDNYYLSLLGTTASITPRPISISDLDARNKVYDGSVDAEYDNTPSPVGLIDGDELSIDISASKAEFDNKNVGLNKAVQFTGFALAGADKDNYSLSQPVGSSADIAQKAISISGLSASNKTYDGNTSAVIVGTALAADLIASDAVSLGSSGAKADFDTKDIGSDKTVTFSGYILSGVDAVNYDLSQPASVTANINQKELSVSGISIASKDYDGSVNASISGTASLTGVVSGEDVSLLTSGVSATYSDANAGTNKLVNISGYAIGGTETGNYSLVAPSLNGDINAIDIAIKANAANKVYDESDPIITYDITSGSLVGADTFTGSISRESGEDVGTYAITQGSLAISSNYNIAFTGNDFIITQAANAITFELDTEEVGYEEGKQIILSATAMSGEAVSFVSSDPTRVQIIGDVLTILKDGYGSVIITATENTDINYVSAAPVELSLTIIPRVVALRKGDNMLLVDNKDELFTRFQWYKSGSAISGATKQYYYNSSGVTGEYYCVVYTSKEDSFTSNTINTSTTQSIAIFPLPAKVGSNFSIQLDGFKASSFEDMIVEVYSITGELVKQIVNPSNMNSMSVDKPGIYIVKTNQDKSLSKRIIIK